MGALAGALVGGGFGLIGQSAQNSANIGAQNAAENFDQAEVQQQEAYETQMSDTAYQRGTADMKAAGINPILAAGGSPASTPALSAPTISQAQQGSPVSSALSSAESAASSAVGLMSQFKDMQKSDSAIKLNEAQANVANKTAGIKSGEADVMTDADQLYNRAKSSFLNWYNASGLNQSSAPKVDSSGPGTDAVNSDGSPSINIPASAPMTWGGASN